MSVARLQEVQLCWNQEIATIFYYLDKYLQK